MEMQGDKEVVLAAVVQSGRALEHASAELRADQEVVLAAVGQDGLALLFASDELRADRDVCGAAVAQNGRALRWASEVLIGDEALVVRAVAQTGLALLYASEDLKRGGLRARLAAHLAAHRNFLRLLWAARTRALHFPHELQRLVFDYAFAKRAHKLSVMRAAAAHLESAA